MWIDLDKIFMEFCGTSCKLGEWGAHCTCLIPCRHIHGCDVHLQAFCGCRCNL